MSYQIEMACSEAIHTAVIRGRVRPQELAQFVPSACGEVWSFVRSAKLPRPGRHLALYLDEHGSVEVGVEVSEPFVGNDRVHCSTLPAGRVATTVHFGPYSLLREAHTAINQWCAERKYRLSGVSWEIYGHWQESWNSDSSACTVAAMKAASSPKYSEPVLKLKVICTELPGLRFCDPHGQPAVREPVYLGIQHRRDVIEQVPADQRTVAFNLEFRVSRNPDGSPNFLGPYAQGNRTDRFFYLAWGVKQTDGRFEMFRRLKLRLGHLTWDQIERSVAKGQPIAVRLRLTDARGSPLCATPPPTNIRWEL